MMKIEVIGRRVDYADSNSVKLALKEMREVPEHEIHYYLVCRDTLQATALQTRQIIALAQVESDRRSTLRVRCLAITTTILSGLVGLAGVGLGAYLAH